MLVADFSAFGLGRMFLLGGPGITPAARAAGENKFVVLLEVDREFWGFGVSWFWSLGFDKYVENLQIFNTKILNSRFKFIH